MRRPAQGVFRFVSDTEDGRDVCDVTEFPRTKVHRRSWKWKLKLVDGTHEKHRTGIIQTANRYRDVFILC